MRLSFSGLDSPLEIKPGRATTLEIENAELFSRICLSLCGGRGRDALEPYTLWDDEGNELSSKDALILVESPLSLPWDDKHLLGAVTRKFQMALLEDEELRAFIDKSAANIVSAYMSLAMTMHAEYGFEIEWDMQRFVRTFGFGVGHEPQRSVLENCMDFLSFVLDADVTQCITFVNLRTFLTEKGLEAFLEHVFFTNVPVLLLEQNVSPAAFKHEQRRLIDMDFVER